MTTLNIDNLNRGLFYSRIVKSILDGKFSFDISTSHDEAVLDTQQKHKIHKHGISHHLSSSKPRVKSKMTTCFHAGQTS